jgi:hypothetical protein
MVCGLLFVLFGVIYMFEDLAVGMIIAGVGLLCVLPGLLIIIAMIRAMRMGRSGGGNMNNNVMQSNDIMGPMGGQQHGQGGQVFCQNCGQSRHSTQQFCGACGGQ